MTQVRVDKGERYPVYTIVDDDDKWAKLVDMPPTLVERAKAALKEFDTVQKMLEKRYKVEVHPLNAL